jgi:uncharacterized protein
VRLEHAFTVAAPLERTWEALLDVERVAGCFPGASIEPVGEDRTYRGQLQVGVGSVRTSYGGTVRLVDVDVDAHVASFDARARETHGTGTAAAVVRGALEAVDGGTRVRVEADLDVTGRPAQVGRDRMEDEAARALDAFAGRLEQLASPRPEPSEAPSGAHRRALPIAGGVLALVVLLVVGRRRPRRRGILAGRRPRR